MKKITIFWLSVLAILVTSCHHTSEPLYVPQSITQLETIIAPWQKDNDLLPWKGVNHTVIINSIEDIYNSQTEKFIQENPDWLNVDFTKKSIISIRTILLSSSYWQYTKVVGFSIFNGEQDYMMIKGDYSLVVAEKYSHYDSDIVDEDESQYRIYQIAFVTDKVPSDARIFLNLEQSISPKAK